ncbi:MAG TPA: tripartite tricarboxylate transporter substrate-binding protein [Burkholderiaceae bacterium]
MCSCLASALAAPVTLVVPFDAGGPTDRMARDLADAMQKPLGARIVIDNVGGAGGTLGATRVAKAAPDGLTLLLHHIGMATAPALYPNLPYRPLEDFAIVGLVAEVPMTLIGRPGLPAANFAELRRWLKARAQKSRINLAHAGPGAASHLCGLLLQSMLKVEMHEVSYKGTAPAINDLIAGHVDLLCDQTSNTAGPIAAGRVKAYAVTTRERLKLPALANLPTLAESGLAGFDVSIWHGLYAPKGTPPATLARLSAALRAARHDAQFVQREEAVGASVLGDGRADGPAASAFLAAEIARWGLIIKAAGPTLAE